MSKKELLYLLQKPYLKFVGGIYEDSRTKGMNGNKCDESA
jgi:hypothetical protein